MVNIMKFASLVASFGVDFEFIEPDDGGKYIAGEWVALEKDAVTKNGAIIPYSNKQIYESGGTITQNDRQLAIAETLPLGATVIDKGNRYKIKREDPYAEHYSDTNIYHLEGVSVFGN